MKAKRSKKTGNPEQLTLPAPGMTPTVWEEVRALQEAWLRLGGLVSLTHASLIIGLSKTAVAAMPARKECRMEEHFGSKWYSLADLEALVKADPKAWKRRVVRSQKASGILPPGLEFAPA